MFSLVGFAPLGTTQVTPMSVQVQSAVDVVAADENNRADQAMAYPRLGASPSLVFNQDTFNRAHAHLMSWQQAAGAFGDLHLHACWGESSVLSRRYHGQTIHGSFARMRGFIRLFDQTGNPRWRLMAEDVCSNILFLQSPEGGFFHASSECEPTYRAEQTCPIHQGMPLLALLAYASWKHAEPMRVELIRPAIDKHWNWFVKHWWQRGNAWQQGLDVAGFCGVTNQDLVIVAALAQYASVFGNSSRYERFGLPTLETYLSPRYYHRQLGLFERGDRPNFMERTIYYDVILPMLGLIHEHKPDPRLPGIIETVSRQLFSAAYIGCDGMQHLAYGAETDPAEARITSWIQEPRMISAYPALLHSMKQYLMHNPDRSLQTICDGLERTIAAYVFADGTLPMGLGSEPLFSIATRNDSMWLFLIDYLGDSLQEPGEVAVPTINRTCNELTFKSNARLWSIFQNGQRLFAGLKKNPGGIAIGADEVIAGADFAELENTDGLYREQIASADRILMVEAATGRLTLK
jgi:hypothetical protein